VRVALQVRDLFLEILLSLLTDVDYCFTNQTYKHTKLKEKKMKKLLLLGLGLFLVASLARAQALIDFKTNISGVEKASDSDGSSPNITGPGLDSLYWAHDPSNSANGVCAMAIHWDSTGQHGRLELGTGGTTNYLAGGTAKYITFWVYIDSAQKVPDSMTIDTYAMDNTNWSWTEPGYGDKKYFIKDIPHNVWYPLSFPLAATLADNPNFAYNASGAGKGFMTGLQFWPNTKASVGWKGVIYVDNVELVGALPHIVAGPGITGFEKSSDSDGSSPNITGPGLDSIYAATDPKGTTSVMAMRIHWDSTGQHGRVELGTGGTTNYLAGGTAKYITFWVYIDSAQKVPDSMTIDTYAMDNTNWSWTEPGYGDKKYFIKDIPHNVWYPMAFPLAATKANNPNFAYNASGAGKGFMTGLQFWPNTKASVGWKGVIYVSNPALLDTVVALPPSTWTAADFETAGTNGKQGFYVPSYASGTLKRVADLTEGSWVLQGAVNISPSAPKFAAVRDTVAMRDPVTDSAAISISFGFYLPTKAPTHALVNFFVSGGAGDSISVIDTVGSQVKGGQFNTLMIAKLDSLATAGKFDPTKPARVGVVLWYPAPYDTSSYAGNVEFDNLVLTGFARNSELADGMKSSNVVTVYKLYNNYPNPFNPSTMIQYDLPRSSRVLVQVYDVLGRLVATLVDNESQGAGTHQIQFNASKLASGVYFYRLTAGSFVSTQRMMLLK
jgi:hypothetical protein